MTTHVYIALSLDGFIARKDSSIDWLTSLPNETESDYGYGAFMDGIDAVVMGRNTFETVLGFGAWPYEKPVFVLSSSLKAPPPGLEDRVSILRGGAEEILAQVEGRGFHSLYIDGGKTIQAFLEKDLIDELTLTWVSIILGGGIALFSPGGHETSLRLKAVERLSEDLVKCRYERKQARGR